VKILSQNTIFHTYLSSPDSIPNVFYCQLYSAKVGEDIGVVVNSSFIASFLILPRRMKILE